jgi:hypothetical protein
MAGTHFGGLLLKMSTTSVKDKPGSLRRTLVIPTGLQQKNNNCWVKQVAYFHAAIKTSSGQIYQSS